MFKISEGAAIALHSMIYLANRSENFISINEIADKFSISANHLSKILQRLLKASFLESSKGPKGGFRIVKNKKNAKFIEIYEIIEGKFNSIDCLFQSNKTNCNNCIMGNFPSRVNKEFKDYLSNHKISEFIL